MMCMEVFGLKKNFFRILFLLAIAAILASSIYQAHLQESSPYTTTIKTSADPNVIYTQDITTDESRIEITVEHIPNNYSPNRYDLKLTPHNITDTQYGYILELDGYSEALVHDSSRAEIAYSENYSAGEHHNQNTKYYFEPSPNHKGNSSAGTLSLRLLHNTHTIPATGVIQFTVTIYRPDTQTEINTISEEIWFPIQ